MGNSTGQWSLNIREKWNDLYNCLPFLNRSTFWCVVQEVGWSAEQPSRRGRNQIWVAKVTAIYEPVHPKWWSCEEGKSGNCLPSSIASGTGRGAPTKFHVHSLVLEDLGNIARDVMETISFCPENIYIYFTLLVNNRLQPVAQSSPQFCKLHTIPFPKYLMSCF